MPPSAAAYSPSTSDADDRRRDVAAGDHRPDRDPDHRDDREDDDADHDRDAARRHPAHARRAACASRNSSRPDVSSDAHTATSVAAARPARMNPNSTNSSWRNPPTEPMSKPGKTWLSSRTKSGELPSSSMNDLPDPAIARPNRPMPEAPGERRRQVLADRAPDRAAQPDEGARQARRRDRAGRADVAPRERLDADDEQDDRDERDRDERRPVELARERDVVRRPAEPAQVRQRRESRDRRLVAVDDEAAEHDRAGDPGRRAAADERRQGERHGARREREQAQPDRVAGGRLQPRSRRPAGPLTVLPDDDERQEDHDRRRSSSRRGARTASRARSGAASSPSRRRTRGCRGAPPGRASPTGRGSTRGWR